MDDPYWFPSVFSFRALQQHLIQKRYEPYALRHWQASHKRVAVFLQMKMLAAVTKQASFCKSHQQALCFASATTLLARVLSLQVTYTFEKGTPCEPACPYSSYISRQHRNCFVLSNARLLRKRIIRNQVLNDRPGDYKQSQPRCTAKVRVWAYGL